MKNLPKFDGSLCIENKKHLPETSGVYFIFENSTLIYIGKSTLIKERLYNHHKLSEFETRENVTIRWIEAPIDTLDSTEVAYIETFLPILNTNHNVTKRSVNNQAERRTVTVYGNLWEMARRKAGLISMSALVRRLLELYIAGEVDIHQK